MRRFPTSFDFASPELSRSVETRWRGYVDRWNPERGIEGWALGIDAPSRPLLLELVVGDDALDIVETTLPRPDIDQILGTATRPGFHFPPSVFARLARLGAKRRDLPVGIRISGTDVVLMPQGRPPTVGELVAAWRETTLDALQNHDPEITKGDRLLARLAGMRADAEAFRDLPLRPTQANEVGHLDVVHFASEGQVWFVGWMKRGVETEFPALVVDRQKYPSGAAVLQYERQDLASNCVGVIGVMDTGWTPPAVSKEFFVYIGDEAGMHLRAGSQTRVVRLDAFLAAYQQVQAVSTGGNSDAIGSILTSGSTWLAGNAAAAGIAAEASVDRLLMLPGFGCIAEGWAVSPAKTVRTFHMKIGDCVLIGDEASTYFKPRPDLQSVAGGGAGVTARAGFVTVLRGALPAAASGAPLLRVVHDDGTAVVQRIEPKTLHLLDPMSDGADVLRLYPSIRHEPFYPAFLDAIGRHLAAKVREPAALTVAPARKVVVIRLPGERNNLNLCFDGIARHLAAGADPETGIALVADRLQGRSDARLLFEELRAATDVPLSFFCVDDADDGFDELPFVLSRLDADRFVYVGRGLVLTSRGWSRATRSLERLGHSVDYLEIIDETGAPDRIDGSLSAASFGWSTTALLGWTTTARRFVHGTFRTNGLPPAPGPDHVLTGAAIRIERARASRLADLIDEDLLRSTGGVRP